MRTAFSKEFEELINDFKKYKTTNIDFHSGDLLEHSIWTAFYVNDIFTNLDMNNPLHKVWNQKIVDDVESKTPFIIDVRKVLIVSAFLHDIGKGGDGKTIFYDKDDHEIIGAEYIDNMTYKKVDNNNINLKKMFKDLHINNIETDIIKVLVRGHWLIGQSINEPNNYELFVKELEGIYKTYITEYNKYVFALVCMMQLIICIADVMATKKYTGHSSDISDFPQIHITNYIPHDTKKSMYDVFNYGDIIDNFVPDVYGYIFDNYINNSADIQVIIDKVDTIPVEFVKTFFDSGYNSIDETLRDELVISTIKNKRFDILSYLLTLDFGDDILNITINELLDNSLLEEFITDFKSSSFADFQKKALLDILISYIINEHLAEGMIPFITTHKDLLKLKHLMIAKESYKEALENNYNEFEAKQIYNEIKDNYTPPPYKDEKHRNYCESLNPIDIPEPLIVDTKNIMFEIPSIIRNFKISYLNNLSMAKKNINLNFTTNKDNYFGGVSSLFGDEFTLDSEWVYKSINYTNNLPIEDIFTILGYTHNGDELVNNFLTGNIPTLNSKINEFFIDSEPSKYKKYYLPIFFQMISLINTKTKILKDNAPKNLLVKIKTFIKNSILSESYEFLLTNLTFFSPEFYTECIRLYSTDLTRIINNSPSMTKTSILYRGVKDKYYYPDPSNKTFQTTTFMSTSYNPESAFEFASKNCCFKKIIAKPGTKGIFIEAITSHPGEFEVLLNVGTKFNIIDDTDKYASYREKGSFKDICNLELKSMNITTMEVVV